MVVLARKYLLTLVLGVCVLMAAVALPIQGRAAKSAQEIQEAMAQTARQIAQYFPQAETITAAKLASMRDDKDVVLVDVRTVAEMRVSILPGALDVRNLVAELDKYRHKTIVAYCTIGVRSARFVTAALGHGLKAKSLEGGILAWVQAGYQVVGPDGAATKKVYVSGNELPLLPAGYEPVN